MYVTLSAIDRIENSRYGVQLYSVVLTTVSKLIRLEHVRRNLVIRVEKQ